MKIRIIINQDIVTRPILAEAILETGIPLNIAQAHFDSTAGEIVADIKDTEYKMIKQALVSRGAEVRKLDTPINWDEDECVECGACVSVCPTKVFSMDKEWNLVVDTTKCIQCGTCIEMCPHDALSLDV
jgi:ferredoxin